MSYHITKSLNTLTDDVQWRTQGGALGACAPPKMSEC